MIYVMPDTCIWFSLMENVDLRSPLRSLERLVNDGEVVILTTEEIQKEFADPDFKKVHQGRTEHDVISTFARRNAKNPNEEISAIAQVLASNPKLYDRANDVAEAAVHAKDLLQRAVVIRGDQEVDAKVLRRMMDRKKPFGNKTDIGKNALNDTVIIEKFAKRAKEGEDDDEFIFVTSNQTDFAVEGNPDEAHDDLRGIFTARRQFTNSIMAVINSVEEAWSVTPRPKWADMLTRRSWQEIMSKVGQLERQAVYHCHLAKRRDIEEGRRVLTPGLDYSVLMRPRRFWQRTWDQEVGKAAGTLADFPFLPSDPDPFKEGMTKGALLALRWVLGSEPEPYPADDRPPAPSSSEADERLGADPIGMPRSVAAEPGRPTPRAVGLRALQDLAVDDGAQDLQ